MALTSPEIEKMIKEILPDAQVQVQDMRGDGSQFAAHVVSAQFEGKNRVQQHQMVYQALKGKVGAELHALSLQTSFPE
jgi:stress-induced morphogen